MEIVIIIKGIIYIQIRIRIRIEKYYWNVWNCWILLSKWKWFNDCKNRINQCYAYIYQIYAKREKNIYSQLDYINKAISFWPEKRYGKNKIFYQNKGNFLKEEMEFKKKLEAEKIEKMNELKKMRFCNDKSITLKE